MKGLKAFLNEPGLKYYEEIVKRKIIEAELHEGVPSFHINPGPMSAGCAKILQATGEDTYRITNAFCAGKMVEDGVKVFCPTEEQCDALGNIDIRVDFKEYKQPFETMVVEFPKDYRIYQSLNFDNIAEPMSPDFQIMYWNGDLLATCIMTSNATGEYHGITTCLNEGEIEDHLRVADRNGIEQCERVLEEEREIIKLFDRISFNSMLLLMEYGCRMNGYSNDRFARKLLKKPGFKNNAELLRRVPQVWVMDREIELFDHETTTHGGEGGSDRVQAPHIRRGHWHHFWTGPGRTVRVRKLVKAVKVNWHLMAPGMKPGITTYKVK